jgi:hypothetical protein
MQRSGGCFLPFSGKNAVILKWFLFLIYGQLPIKIFLYQAPEFKFDLYFIQ